MPRRLLPLSKQGHWTSPKKIEGGAHSGKVLKTVRWPYEKIEDAQAAQKKTLHFQEALREAGIPLVPAEVRTTGQGKAFRLHFLQQPIPREQMLADRFQQGSAKECLEWYRGMMENLEKGIRFNRTQKTKISLDANFDNWALRGGKPALFDFFIPRIKEGNFYRDISFPLVKSRLFKAGHYLLYPVFVRRAFDASRQMVFALMQAREMRPELGEKFLQESRDFVSRNFSGTKKKKLLGQLQRPEKLRRLSWLGKLAARVRDGKKEKAKKEGGFNKKEKKEQPKKDFY